MNKKLLSLLMAGTLSLSALPYSALATGSALSTVAEPTTFKEDTFESGELDKVKQNLEAVEVSYDGNGAIVVTADLDKMVSYSSSDASEGKWFPLLLTFTSKPQATDEIKQVDIDDAKNFGGTDNSAIAWINADSLAKKNTATNLTFKISSSNTDVPVTLKVNDVLSFASAKKATSYGNITDTTEQGYVTDNLSKVTVKSTSDTITIKGDLASLTSYKLGGAPSVGRWVPLILTFDDAANISSTVLKNDDVSETSVKAFGGTAKKDVILWVDCYGKTVKDITFTDSVTKAETKVNLVVEHTGDALALNSAVKAAKYDSITDETEKANVNGNLAAIKDVKLENGKLTVTADRASMTEYSNGSKNGRWFPLVLTFNDVTNITSDVLNPEDITDAEKFGGAAGKSVVLWVDALAKDATKSVELTFKDQVTGKTVPVTLEVVDYVETTTPDVPDVPDVPDEPVTETITPADSTTTTIKDNATIGKIVSGSAIGSGTATPKTVDEVKALFSNKGTLTINTPDGKELTTGNVYSGCKIVLDNGSGATDTVTIIIKGAASTTGKTEISDIAKFARAYGNSKNAPAIEMNIFDMDDDGKVDLVDIAKFAKQYGSTTN